MGEQSSPVGTHRPTGEGGWGVLNTVDRDVFEEALNVHFCYPSEGTVGWCALSGICLRHVLIHSCCVHHKAADVFLCSWSSVAMEWHGSAVLMGCVHSWWVGLSRLQGAETCCPYVCTPTADRGVMWDGLCQSVTAKTRSCTWLWWPVGTDWMRRLPWSSLPSSSASRGSSFTSLQRTPWPRSSKRG